MTEREQLVRELQKKSDRRLIEIYQKIEKAEKVERITRRIVICVLVLAAASLVLLYI